MWRISRRCHELRLVSRWIYELAGRLSLPRLHVPLPSVFYISKIIDSNKAILTPRTSSSSPTERKEGKSGTAGQKEKKRQKPKLKGIEYFLSFQLRRGIRKFPLPGGMDSSIGSLLVRLQKDVMKYLFLFLFMLARTPFVVAALRIGSS